MPHTIIHCGTAGETEGEMEIKIYCGSVMNYAVALWPHKMLDYGVSEREMEAFEQFLEDHRQKLVNELRRLGIPYCYHNPHPENLEPHD